VSNHEWLRKRMTQRNLTVSDLARMSGVTRHTVRHALAGGRTRLLTQMKLTIGVMRPRLRVVR